MKHEEETLHILWSTGEQQSAEKMVLMYGGNALRRGWWKQVTIIIWGASVSLIAGSPGIQERIRALAAEGVTFTACRACAEQLGQDSLLESLGVEVVYWGERLTELLAGGRPLLTV